MLHQSFQTGKKQFLLMQRTSFTSTKCMFHIKAILYVWKSSLWFLEKSVLVLQNYCFHSGKFLAWEQNCRLVFTVHNPSIFFCNCYARGITSLVKYADTLKWFGFLRSQWCRFQSWKICEEVQCFQYSHWEKTSEGFLFGCIPPSFMSFLVSCKIYHYPTRNFSKNAIMELQDGSTVAFINFFFHLYVILMAGNIYLQGLS